MEEFRIKLAGTAIGLRTIYPRTKNICRDYLTDEEPELYISTSEADISAERQMSIEAAELEGTEAHSFRDDYLESLAAYRMITTALSARDCALMHGAAIAVDGEVYIFTARSGTGKTTHIRLWLEKFGDRAIVVNGDKPILKLADGSIYVCGTPWCGKEHLNANVILPLKAVCILERSDENSIVPITAAEALPTLMAQLFRPAVPESMRGMLKMADSITRLVPLYRLGCNMQPEAADVSYSGMNS